MKTIQKKVCLLGEFAVGKTSLIRRFVDGRFDEKYLSTIGVNLSRKMLARADHQLSLLLWDLAGGDDYVNVTASYLRGAAGALIVCDLTRRDTLDGLSRYAQQLRDASPEAVILLIANKADLLAERAVEAAELRAIGQALQAPVILTSAKTGSDVETAFAALADLMEGNNVHAFAH